MIFSYNWLQSYFKKRLPKPKELAELLSMHAFEVEEIEKAGKDWTLNIDVLPNRAPDCFSHLGIGREISALLDCKPQFIIGRLAESKKNRAENFIEVKVKNTDTCPRYTVRVITDVKIKPSPKWIKARLKVCGLRPINNVVDIANYVMLETGQPLHAFDGEKLEGKKIIVRFAREKERIVTLDGEKYELNNKALVIADEKKPVAIAGIKGGVGAEIDKKTKIVILESANFDQKTIRKTSRSLNLRTDASWRFENGIDPNLTETAINRAAYLIQEIAGGKVTRGLIDIYPKKVLPKQIKLDLDYVERLLGVKISKKEIVKILKKLNFECNEEGVRYLIVKIPTFRLDITIPEDLIEEIGRIYGYGKVPSVFPISALIPPKRNLDIFWENPSKDILKEAGLTEVYNYSFISEREKEIFNYSAKGDISSRARHKEEIIEIENPVTVEQKFLRPSLMPNLLKNVKNNLKYFKEVKIFELGKVFKIAKSKSQGTNLTEKRMLTGLMTGDAFYQIKGIVDLLLNKLGISNIWYDEYQPTPEESKISTWKPKKCAEIKVDQKEIGFLGEVSSKILEDYKIEEKVVIFDLDFEKLSRLASEEHEYRPISQYPAAIRDLAVLVPQWVRIEEVLNKIDTVAGALLRDIDIFDIYEGQELPEGKKNLAFHLIFQAKDRTLTSKEIDVIHQKIIKALERNPGWQVRK